MNDKSERNVPLDAAVNTARSPNVTAGYSSGPRTAYRPDIDGLRGVAVLPVILFHAGFEWFSGGYVGVDVFFVISGYLITRIIVDEKERGQFSLSGFYERRVRRILPALYLVMLWVVPFAWIWLPPSLFRDFSQSLAAAIVFSSNFLFWMESGYFEADAAVKPLLHTWSLAIEEQFYVVYPALLIVLWKFGEKVVFAVIAALSVASFLLCVRLFLDNQSAAFFLAPARIWELGVGAMCALYLFRREQPQGLLSGMGSVLGLALIAFAIAQFDSEMPYPGYYALVPTIGTALVILFNHPSAVPYRSLSSAPLVFVGLISYSAYLWHYPIFVFGDEIVTGEVSPQGHFPLIALTLACAYISWRYVERPFRQRSVIRARKMFAVLVPFTFLLIGVGVFGHVTNGAYYRFAEAEKQVLAYSDYPMDEYYRTGKCFLEEGQTGSAFSAECEQRGSEDRRVVVWGDSHAAAIHLGVFSLFEDWGHSQFTKSGCPPVMELELDKRPLCDEFNRWVLQRIGTYSNPVVVIHANWKNYVDDEGFTQKLAQTLRALTGNATEIFVVGGVPQWDEPLPVRYINTRNKGIRDDNRTIMIETPRLEELRAADDIVRKVVEDEGIQFLSVLDKVCGAHECDAAIRDRGGRVELLLWDNAHLTRTGSVRTVRKLEELTELVSVDRASRGK